MESHNIFVKSDISLDEFAIFFRKICNIGIKNVTTFQLSQKRYGENYGGDYYLFESLGMEFYLVHNKGEMLEDEFEKYPYYLILNINEFSLNGFGLSITQYIRCYLASHGVESEINSI
ncbi:MAG TPA: hypothetical protein PL108_08645 [Sediminibacterium sp.]|nr:hypothetical protein [Sediminibacterium sp.]